MLRSSVAAVSLLIVCLTGPAPAQTLDPRWSLGGPPLALPNELVFDPTSTDIAFLAANNGLYRSGDGGVSWTIARGSEGLRVVDVALTGDRSRVYAATPSGLLTSTDGGVSFTLSGPGWFAIEADPMEPNVVYGLVTDGQGLVRSVDGGVTLVPASVVASGGYSPIAFAIDPSSRSTVYFAMASSVVYKSTNSGATFVNAGAATANVQARDFAMDPVTPSTMYLATSNGLFRSTDAAGSWSPVPTGAARNLHDISISGSSLAVASQEGVFVSRNNGGTWDLVGQFPAGAVALHPAHPDLLLASSSRDQLVLRSTTSTPVFTQASSGLTSGLSKFLEVSPNDRSALFFLTENAVYRSRDHGRSFQQLNVAGRPIDVAVDASSSARVYVIVDGRVMRSTDDGATFAPFAEGLADAQQLFVVADPRAPEVVYCMSIGRVHKRTGSGPWQLSFGGIGGIAPVALEIAATDPVTLYAVAHNGGFYRSSDAASTWTALPQIPLGGATVTSLQIDPFDASHLLLATSKVPMESTDGGATWKPVTGFDDRTTILFDPAMRGRLWAHRTSLVQQRQPDGTWKHIATDNRVDATTARLAPHGRVFYAAGSSGGLWILSLGKQRAAGR